MLSAGIDALAQFEPQRTMTFGSSLEAYVDAASAELARYAEQVRKEVVALAEQLLLPLSATSKAQVLETITQAFDESLYVTRLETQKEMMLRLGAQCGGGRENWNGIRTDLLSARHHAQMANQVRHHLAVIEDDLEFIRIRSSRAKTSALPRPGENQLPSKTTNFNTTIHNHGGDHSRFYQGSVDNSLNVVPPQATVLIEALRSELRRNQLDGPERTAALEAVDEVENSFRSGKPKKTVIAALLKTLPQVASIAGTIASILKLFD